MAGRYFFESYSNDAEHLGYHEQAQALFELFKEFQATVANTPIPTQQDKDLGLGVACGCVVCVSAGGRGSWSTGAV